VTGWGLDTLFNPSKRHMDEEKRRLQATREEVGDNSGGERIEDSTDKVVIKRQAKTDGPVDTAKARATTEAEDSDADTAAARARRRRAARKPA